MNKIQFHFLIMIGCANLAVSTSGIVHWILWGFTCLFVSFVLLDSYVEAVREQKLKKKGLRVIKY